MKKAQPKRAWVLQSEEPKAAKPDKAKILAQVKEAISGLPKLSKKVSRLDMRANRIYMYELVEQAIREGVTFTKPLIDGKYLEMPYARITMQDAGGERCTVDCQRYNDQWMTLYSGTLPQCINGIENDDGWF
jgi:hypothetical protein